MNITPFKLPIGGSQVSSLDELRENFSAEITEHLKSGVLELWLYAIGHAQEAYSVAQIDCNRKNTLEEICNIFKIFISTEVRGKISSDPFYEKIPTSKINQLINQEKERDRVFEDKISQIKKLNQAFSDLNEKHNKIHIYIESLKQSPNFFSNLDSDEKTAVIINVLTGGNKTTSTQNINELQENNKKTTSILFGFKGSISREAQSNHFQKMSDTAENSLQNSLTPKTNTPRPKPKAAPEIPGTSQSDIWQKFFKG